MPTISPIPAILLAAGLSSRMGDFKPTLPLAGKPLILHVLDALAASQRIAPILIITGNHRERIEAAVANRPNVHCHFNPNFAAGEMLSSLRTGISALPGSAPGFLLAFADQPAVNPATITTLVENFFTHPSAALVVPTYLQKRGHPILLSSALIPEITALPANETLRTIVHRHLSRAILVEVPDPAILEDLDTPADLARAQARHAQ